jgi:GNAT superfamily N-acetyltransferase
MVAHMEKMIPINLNMTQPIIETRQAVITDVAAIAGFNIALCRETEGRELDAVTVSEGVRRFVSEPARGRYFVVLLDGEVVGQTAHTFEWSDWRNGEIWWIQSVYVHPQHRGRGVFRALFAHIRQLGETHADCCGIRLYMERDNDSARQSYHRLGFSETGYEVFELLFSAHESLTSRTSHAV